jgi:anti-sigma factor RsiW
MNCNEAIELLPWLLNGTVGEGERREVRQHLETCESCREALAGTGEAWTIFSQHLPSETLVALAYGEAPEGIDAALAERHLASCPECATELELARTSRRLELEEPGKIALFPGPKPRPVSDTGYKTWRAAALAASVAGLLVAGGWFQSSQEVRRLSTEVAAKPAPAPAPAERPDPDVPRYRGGDPGEEQVAKLKTELNQALQTQEELEKRMAEAASQMAELQKAPRGLDEPRLNTWNGELGLVDVVRGDEDDEIVIPAGVLATPILPAEKEATSPNRDIEILDAAGKIVWGSSGLRRSSDTPDYTLTLPPGFLKPGRYTIQLYSTEGGKRTPRETYKIRVQ